jgi:hypothetical protein
MLTRQLEAEVGFALTRYWDRADCLGLRLSRMRARGRCFGLFSPVFVAFLLSCVPSEHLFHLLLKSVDHQ